MAQKSQYVTIPLDEYRELLLRERPDDRSGELCARMIAMLADHVVYDEHDDRYWSSSIGDHLKAKNGDEMVKDMVTMLKYVDFERYMEIWNGTMTAERNRKAMEEKVAQMNEAREIRESVREG